MIYSIKFWRYLLPFNAFTFKEDEEKILLKEQKQKEKEKAQAELLKQEQAKEEIEENNTNNVGLLKVIEEEKLLNIDDADPEENKELAANISDIVSSTASVKVINVQVHFQRINLADKFNFQVTPLFLVSY